MASLWWKVIFSFFSFLVFLLSFLWNLRTKILCTLFFHYSENSYSLYLERTAYYASTVILKKWVAIWKSRKTRVYIKRIFILKKGTTMFLQPPRFCLSSGLFSSLLDCSSLLWCWEMFDDQITQQRQVERKYLLDVIKCLRYLAYQRIP